MRTVIAIFLILSVSPVFSQTVEEVIEKVNTTIESTNSVEYKGTYHFKPISHEDTSVFHGEVKLSRLADDEIYGYQFLIRGSDSSLKVYRPGEWIWGDYVRDTYTIRNLEEYPDDDPMGGSIPNYVLNSQLMKPIDLGELKKEKAEIQLCSDCGDELVIEITYPGSKEIEENTESIYVDRSTYLPYRITHPVVWMGKLQYTEWVGRDLRSNDPDIEKAISEFSFSKLAEVEMYTPKEKKKPLGNGTTPPDFTFKDLDGKEWTLSQLKGKVVLLDFWYMSCYPCIKAIPDLQKLHEKYADDGLVILGINSLDNNDSRRDRIPKFKKEKAATYTVLLGDRSLDEQYNVEGYPQFYLIGKDGKIVASQTGFGPGFYKEMKVLIKNEL